MLVHSFHTDDAEKHGVDKAVVLYNLRFWLEKNKANKRNLHDGYYWTYNTAEAFSELFPYFTPSKISRLLRQLEDDGLIISNHYNKKGYDRTKWYSMPEYSILHIYKSQFTYLKNGIYGSVQPIPYINHIKNTDIKKPKSKGKKTTEKKPTSIPDDFKPTDKQLEKMKLYGIDADLLVESFISGSKANGKKYKCWNSALTTWINNEIKWNKLKPINSQPTHSSYQEFDDDVKPLSAEEKRAAFEKAMRKKEQHNESA